jgi:hypothetical protein
MLFTSLVIVLSVIACLLFWRHGGRCRTTPGWCLRVEELEFRRLPAVCLWAWNGVGAGEFTQQHWRKQPDNADDPWEYSGVPGANDDVIFAATFTTGTTGQHTYEFNSDCKLATAAHKVRSVTFM